MAIKFVLNLKKDSSPHLPIERFINIIKKDEFILPETRVILESLRKARQPYVPLPLSHEVIISPEYQVTLHKDLRPLAKIYTRINWSENNKAEYKKDKEGFYLDIIQLYNDCGYELERFDDFDIKIIDKVMQDLEKEAKKAYEKWQRKMKRLGK